VATGDELREVMRGYPHGVAVLTVDDDGQRMGVTIGSLVSLSLDPPLVGVSIGKQASSYELLRGAGEFALSLLREEQDALARRFASGLPPLVHWQGVDTSPASHVGAPLIAGALGWLECRTWATYDVGDHTLFVGEVLAAERDPAARPLVYIHGEYRSL
jgi:flavin reductase (DIM6/NTAB) family NADH-FMN oxidoreductase RutF